jgi:hypothetical protein
MPYETAEEFSVFRQAAELNLNEGKSVLERSELLEELLLGELLLGDTATFLVLNVATTFHDDAPWCCALGWINWLTRPAYSGLLQGTSIATRPL